MSKTENAEIKTVAVVMADNMEADLQHILWLSVLIENAPDARKGIYCGLLSMALRRVIADIKASFTVVNEDDLRSDIPF